jgi:Holliday junction resolvase-like predicted endonuclease
VTFTLSGTNPEQVRKRLIEVAGGLGWHVAPTQKPFGDQDLILKRGKEMCVIRVRTIEEESQTLSSVTMVVVDRESH